MQLVRGGRLALLVQYDVESKWFNVHERCIKKTESTQDLGLPATTSDNHVATG